MGGGVGEERAGQEEGSRQRVCIEEVVRWATEWGWGLKPVGEVRDQYAPQVKKAQVFTPHLPPVIAEGGS